LLVVSLWGFPGCVPCVVAGLLVVFSWCGGGEPLGLEAVPDEFSFEPLQPFGCLRGSLLVDVELLGHECVLLVGPEEQLANFVDVGREPVLPFVVRPKQGAANFAHWLSQFIGELALACPVVPVRLEVP
jgi:hypothetical protein